MTIMCSLDGTKCNPGVFAVIYISPDYASLHPGYGSIEFTLAEAQSTQRKTIFFLKK